VVCTRALFRTRSLVQPSPDYPAIMFVRAVLLSLSALAAARELPKDEVKAAQLYDSGIKHANNVALKRVLPNNCMSSLSTDISRNLGRSTRQLASTHLSSTLRSQTL
jgi:hypothetical protein